MTLLQTVVSQPVNTSEASELGMEATFKGSFLNVFVFHLLVSVVLFFVFFCLTLFSGPLDTLLVNTHFSLIQERKSGL